MALVLVPGRLAASVPARALARPAAGGRADVGRADVGRADVGRVAVGGVRVGRVDVVGLGPGASEWLTPQAKSVLATADHIVGYGPYVDRVAPNPRQQRHSSDNRVESERAEFALDLALRGNRVAVVSSGDPGVFAMGSAVVEVGAQPRYAGVEIGVVPGLTAAQAVASQVGAPLGHDFAVISLSDRLKPWPVVAARLEAAAGADLVIAIYNPASKSRRHQVVDAQSLLLGHRHPATPVVVGRAVGSDAQSTTVTTLGELDPESIDMRCLLIIGSSQTQVVPGPGGRPRVFTPRRYPESGIG
jgi:precorrin-2 C20-methyltransferase/precorrin-3B C17-methyltransferase